LNGDAVAYVLVMTFPASHIADLLHAARLHSPWIIGVTDNNGIILARSERHEDFVGRPLPAELLAQSRTATTVFRSTNVVGEPILRASVRSEIAGWLVSATVPVSYADAPRRHSQLFALAMIGVALALGAALAFLFGALMARPLTAAAAAAEAVGRGEQVAPLRSRLVEANILTAALSEASSELKRGREYSDFLMRELAHRAKNQLAVVRGMALQTAKQSRSLDEFATQFTKRIQGFAESQDLLLRQNWQGAWMSDLVRAQLDLYAAGRRAEASGPPVFLSAKAVQNIGFALHELATNASKHGALSKPGGRVVIAWDRPCDGDRIRLEWVEQNGPSVTAPLRQGFGHLVLTQLVPAALQGTSTLEFGSDGVRWQLEIPTSDAVSAPGTPVETYDDPLS
jgi:two-component sensor histidine kinase